MTQFQKEPLQVLIPIKGTNNKSRLSPVLNVQQREQLTQWMLRQTVSAMKTVTWEKTIHLIGHPSDDASQTLARDMGVQFISESFESLNPALQAEVDRCFSQKQSVLVLFADLPFINSDTINGLLATVEDSKADLILAPDEHESGTNALFYRGSQPLKMQYGPDSFAHFIKQAETLNLYTATFVHPFLSQDLDTPEDWQLLQSRLANLGFSLEAHPASSSH